MQISHGILQRVYVIAASDEGPCKIGRASNVRRRLKQLQVSHHQRLIIQAEFETRHPSAAEWSIHHYLAAKRMSGEWFNIPVAEAVKMAGEVTASLDTHKHKTWPEDERMQEAEHVAHQRFVAAYNTSVRVHEPFIPMSNRVHCGWCGIDFRPTISGRLRLTHYRHIPSIDLSY